MGDLTSLEECKEESKRRGMDVFPRHTTSVTLVSLSLSLMCTNKQEANHLFYFAV